ncbi:MAG: BlaI/MecI/CopY family transcriptional regulator [Clostridiales bacterium]|nr:BlaI/MecI/CopY family transcriptional regulator [Clostridiales bacterium]
MSIQCTDAEWKILEVLWQSSPRTMAEITRQLEPETGWTRHTVITLLKRMCEKKTVSVDETGDVKRYSPLVTRYDASADQTSKLLCRVFGGNASLLVHHLVDTGELNADDVQELLREIQKTNRP